MSTTIHKQATARPSSIIYDLLRIRRALLRTAWPYDVNSCPYIHWAPCTLTLAINETWFSAWIYLRQSQQEPKLFSKYIFYWIGYVSFVFHIQRVYNMCCFIFPMCLGNLLLFRHFCIAQWLNNITNILLSRRVKRTQNCRISALLF